MSQFLMHSSIKKKKLWKSLACLYYILSYLKVWMSCLSQGTLITWQHDVMLTSCGWWITRVVLSIPLYYYKQRQQYAPVKMSCILQTLTCRALLSLLVCCLSSSISCSFSSLSACRRLWVLWLLWRSWFKQSSSSFRVFSRPLIALAESFAAWSSSLSSCTRTFGEKWFRVFSVHNWRPVPNIQGIFSILSYVLKWESV